MDITNPESNFAFLPNDLLIRCVTSDHVVKDLSEKSYIGTAIWQPRYRANKNGENVNIDKEGLSLLLHRLISPSCSETSCQYSVMKCHCSCKRVKKYSDCSVYLNYRNAMSNNGVSFKLTPNKIILHILLFAPILIMWNLGASYHLNYTINTNGISLAIQLPCVGIYSF